MSLGAVSVCGLDERAAHVDMGFIQPSSVVRGCFEERQNLMFSVGVFIRTTSGQLALPITCCATREHRRVAATTPRGNGYPAEQVRLPPAERAQRHLLAHLITQATAPVLVFSHEAGAPTVYRKHRALRITSAPIMATRAEMRRVGGRSRISGESDRVAGGNGSRAPPPASTSMICPFLVNYDLRNVPEDYVHRSAGSRRAVVDGACRVAGVARRVAVVPGQSREVPWPDISPTMTWGACVRDHDPAVAGDARRPTQPHGGLGSARMDSSAPPEALRCLAGSGSGSQALGASRVNAIGRGSSRQRPGASCLAKSQRSQSSGVHSAAKHPTMCIGAVRGVSPALRNGELRHLGGCLPAVGL